VYGGTPQKEDRGEKTSSRIIDQKKMWNSRRTVRVGRKVETRDSQVPQNRKWEGSNKGHTAISQKPKRNQHFMKNLDTSKRRNQAATPKVGESSRERGGGGGGVGFFGVGLGLVLFGRRCGELLCQAVSNRLEKRFRGRTQEKTAEGSQKKKKKTGGKKFTGRKTSPKKNHYG